MKKASQPEDISELHYLTLATNVESQCRMVNQEKRVLSNTGKIGSKKVKGLEPGVTSAGPELISDGGNYRNMRLKSSSIQARPTEETWMKKAIL